MTIVCVIDEGSSQIKLRATMDGTVKTVKFPSIAVNKGLNGMDGPSVSAYTANGFQYTVLPSHDHPERTDTENYQTSVLNRVFLHEALRIAGLGGREITLGVTLPINQYFNLGQGGGINQRRIAEKKANTMGDITNNAGEPLATIVDVMVFPEALPASADVLTEMVKDVMTFKPEYEEEKRVCCIDAGGHSVDIVVFNSMTGTIFAQESIESGVLKIIDTLQSTLMPVFDSNTAIERSVASTALISRKVGKTDVSDIINLAARDWANQVVGAVKRLAKERSTDIFLVVGGGAPLIEDQIIDHATKEKTIVPADADESIVRGIAKIMQTRLTKQAQKECEAEAVV